MYMQPVHPRLVSAITSSAALGSTPTCHTNQGDGTEHLPAGLCTGRRGASAPHTCTPGPVPQERHRLSDSCSASQRLISKQRNRRGRDLMLCPGMTGSLNSRHRHRHTHTQMHTHMHMHMRMRTRTNAHVHTRAHTHARTHVSAHTHAHAHAHTHAHMHTPRLSNCGMPSGTKPGSDS